MRSSTSSSDPLELGWPGQTCLPQVRPLVLAILSRAADAIRGWRTWIAGLRWPWGLVLAVLFVIGAHVLAIAWHPEPVAAPNMRRKVLDLTARRRPSVVICGDSRLLALRPSLVGDALDLDAGEVINVSVVGSHPDAALAVVREFQGRLAQRPVLLVSVLMTQVDEHSDWWEPDEYLWQAPLGERWRLGGFRNVVRPVFLPEQALWTDLVELLRPVRRWDDYGYHASGPDNNMARRGRAWLENQVEAFVRHDLAEAEIDGPRWRRLEAVIEQLGRSPVQLVVVNPPMYPGVKWAFSTAAYDRWEQFQSKVSELCTRCQVSLLFYDTWAAPGADEAALYSDMIHLNAAGAQSWSRQVGEDLRRLVTQGYITLRTENRESTMTSE